MPPLGSYPGMPPFLHPKQLLIHDDRGWDGDRTQGWCSGESTCLPPMWRGYNSPTQLHMWFVSVLGSFPWSEMFFSGYSIFPLPSQTDISKFQFNLDTVDEESPLGCATANSCLFIYLLKKTPFSLHPICIFGRMGVILCVGVQRLIQQDTR